MLAGFQLDSRLMCSIPKPKCLDYGLGPFKLTRVAIEVAWQRVPWVAICAIARDIAMRVTC
jgi:hypothetical protein